MSKEKTTQKDLTESYVHKRAAVISDAPTARKKSNEETTQVKTRRKDEKDE